METNTSVTILIVDDKTENIFALEKLLERPERTFLKATDGNDGLRLALEKNIDLIILDVQMPGMDGFEVAQVLKSHKKTKDIPIIFASAEKKERQSIMKGFEEGAVDYLSKPLDPDLTRAKVSVLLKIQLQKKELLEKTVSLEKAHAQINQLNADLHKNIKQLELTNKDLESFSYSVSHDLRSPLRSIIGYSKMLEEDCLDLNDNAKKSLKAVQRNAEKMNRLIDDLLEFSKTGRKELVKSEVNVKELIQNTVTEICNSVNHKAEIRLGYIDSTYADHSLLTQVWINLISNAIKYSAKKENPVVEIGSQRSENNIVYYVKDNGAGFSMDYVDKLFGVFQRLHKSDEFEGTGVGLAIVQRIITRHGGQIWAEAKVDEGATFYFSLPVNL
jgi:two-component system, sensor histidine kinase and response regulator